MSHHQTAQTSVEAYRHLDTTSLITLILGLMREGGEWCIADIATELQLERSTVSARLNELRNMSKLEYTGKKPSRRTGVMSMHWKIPKQEQLL